VYTATPAAEFGKLENCMKICKNVEMIAAEPHWISSFSYPATHIRLWVHLLSFLLFSSWALPAFSTLFSEFAQAKTNYFLLTDNNGTPNFMII